MIKHQNILKIFLTLLVAAILLVVIMPKASNFRYHYEKGSKWEYETLYAQFDFPILKTDEQIAEEIQKLSGEFIPYYKMSAEVADKSLAELKALGLDKFEKSALISSFSSMYDKGVVSDNIATDSESNEPEFIYIQKDKRARKCPVDEVFRLSDARNRLLDILPDSTLRAAGVYEILVPNLLYDSQLTDIVGKESQVTVSYTDGYVKSGQVIVSKDEMITPEIVQMLDSYRAEYEASIGYSGPVWLEFFGEFLLIISLLILLALVVYIGSPLVLNGSGFIYIIFLFCASFVTTAFVSEAGQNLLYLVPYTLTALFLRAFFPSKFILPVYLVCLMPLMVFSNIGGALFVMFAVAGVVSMCTFDYLNHGWRQFISALITFCVLFAIFIAFRFSNMVEGAIYRRAIYLLFGSMLTVAGYPLIFLFEKIFSLVSSSRLNEISDTSNKLLRQLESKAPGTLQHSLQVMNMAEAAARAIGANPLLVRAGALYHDVGKLNNPLCFVENESLLTEEHSSNYHHDLSPEQSAADIIKHVSDGIDIARKNGLPEIVIDFIRTHHGTTTVKYFYTKYLNDGGSEAMVSNFRYDGIKPQTKEQVVLMLCDSVEAASRTLKSFTPESYDEFVEGIVKGKSDEGQFDEAEISLKELGVIKETLKSYLAQLYHDRIAYPKRTK